MTKYIAGIWALCLLCGTLAAQVVGKPEGGTFALTNATLVTVTNGEQQGNLIIQDGRIAAMGPNAAVPSGAEEIDCSGKRIYPGLIDAGTSLGLIEVGSISLTQDANEIGNIIPHMEALTAVNPNSVAIPVTRVEGVTTVVTAPRGGTISGTAALIDLVGYTPEQMYAGFKGIVVNWPNASRRGRRDRRSDEERKKDQEKQLKELNDLLESAMLYDKILQAAESDNSIQPEYNPQAAAMTAVVRKEMPLLIEVNREADIKSAMSWVAENDVDVIFTGVAEGWRVADSLAAANIPCIVGPMLSIPTRASDRYDVIYKNPGLMAKAGVKVAIRSGDTENVRNLPYNAGFAAAYGMGKEEALRAITIVPAEIMGVADEIGSLEVGKRASLFIATGDPMEPRTDIEQVFINGYKIPMNSRHTLLYDEFLERNPGLDKE